MPTQSIALASAPSDHPQASALAAFLETNLPVSVSLSEALITPQSDLIHAAGKALGSDVALILLSPASVPAVWKREKWEPVLLQSPADLGALLGFVLLADCTFPPLFRRQPFFDARTHPNSAFRAIRRWLLRPSDPITSPDLTADLIHLADQPATAADIPLDRAEAFATTFAADFELTLRIDCHHRTRAGIVGEIGARLGLRLPRDANQNRARLSAWCAEHRILLLLANVAPADRDFAHPSGRATTIFVESEGRELPAYAAPPLNESAWSAVSRLRVQERFAEALEAIDRIVPADSAARIRLQNERHWLLLDLGLLESAAPVPPPGDPAQLTLFS